MIHIVLAGQAIGKQRVRFSRASGRAYTPEKTVSYEGRLAYAAQQAMDGRSPLEGPVAVEATIYVSIPASKSKKWKAAALAGAIRPTSKPDIDNVIKSSFDGLNLVVWVDDSQVVELKTAKWYSDAPRLEMWVQEVQPTEGIFS